MALEKYEFPTGAVLSPSTSATDLKMGQIKITPYPPQVPNEPIVNGTFKITDYITQDKKKHNHYFKNVEKLTYIDVYRVLSLFNVTDPCIQHAVKKLLVAGGRGAGKDIDKDIQEAIDSLTRFQEMKNELL